MGIKNHLGCSAFRILSLKTGTAKGVVMTEYPWGLGKDRRVLSRVHSKEWLEAVVIPAQKPRYGSKNGHCKLTEEQVKAIKADKDHTGPYLAKLYGVQKAQIYRIQKGKSRKRG